MSAETAALDELVRWLSDWPDDLLGKIRHAGETLDWLLGGLPSALAEQARRLWDEVCRYTDQVVT